MHRYIYIIHGRILVNGNLHHFFFWLKSRFRVKTHENKLSIVPSQMFVLTFQTRLYIDKGWLNFSFNTQTFLFYTNLPFICRIIENSRRNVSRKCGIHLKIWKNKLFRHQNKNMYSCWLILYIEIKIHQKLLKLMFQYTGSFGGRWNQPRGQKNSALNSTCF